uniref:SHSP domain-containing protein n=1 Tax=Setaria digitata TaxID=48799 RepID=A0A915PFC9_9BILA
MFRSCGTDEKIKKLQDGMVRFAFCHREINTRGQSNVTLIASAGLFFDSFNVNQKCRQTPPLLTFEHLENELWRCERLRDTVSGSNVEHHTAKSLNSLNRAQNSMGLRLPAGSQQLSSSIDDIINTEHGFTIQLDAKHFQPRDIQITLYHHTLSVSGDRLEDDGTGAQRLCRSFTRKYTIPPDVRLSSISSYVTNSGYLIIKGSRKGWKETDLTEHLASTSPSSESKISAV